LFRKISETDYGIYEVEVRFFGLRSGTDKLNFTLSRTQVPELSQQIINASIIVSVLAVIIIALFVVIWKMLYLKVFYKRYFAAYKTGN